MKDVVHPLVRVQCGLRWILNNRTLFRRLLINSVEILMILKFNKFNMDDKLKLTLVLSVSGCRVLIVLTRCKLIIVYKDAIKSGKITIY